MNRVMPRLALSASALLLLAGGAAAKPAIAASTVNLRAEANTTSEVLAKIPTGARLDVGDCNDGWCAVTYQGKSGFSIATALDTSGKPRRVVRRLGPGPGAGPDDDFEPVPPGYVGRGPAVVYAPGPYYYGPGPYYGYGYGWGYGRWGYGRGWRRW
jgi:hypothetical protein